MPDVRDPIKVLLTFDSLHADNDGEITLKFKLPATECVKAAIFPAMSGIVFEGVFTPDSVEDKKTKTPRM